MELAACCGGGHLLASLYVSSNLVDSGQSTDLQSVFSVQAKASHPIHLCLLPLTGLAHREEGPERLLESICASISACGSRTGKSHLALKLIS